MHLLYKDAGNSPIEQVSLVGWKMIQTATPPPTSTIHTPSCFILSEGFYFFQVHIYVYTPHIFTTYVYYICLSGNLSAEFSPTTENM